MVCSGTYAATALTAPALVCDNGSLLCSDSLDDGDGITRKYTWMGNNTSKNLMQLYASCIILGPQ